MLLLSSSAGSSRMLCWKNSFNWLNGIGEKVDPNFAKFAKARCPPNTCPLLMWVWSMPWCSLRRPKQSWAQMGSVSNKSNQKFSWRRQFAGMKYSQSIVFTCLYLTLGLHNSAEGKASTLNFICIGRRNVSNTTWVLVICPLYLRKLWDVSTNFKIAQSIGILHINYTTPLSGVTTPCQLLVSHWSAVVAQQHRTGNASAELLVASMRSRKDSFGGRVAHGGPVVLYSFSLGAPNESNWYLICSKVIELSLYLSSASPNSTKATKARCKVAQKLEKANNGQNQEKNDPHFSLAGRWTITRSRNPCLALQLMEILQI